MKKLQNKKNQRIKNIGIYAVIVIFTISINIPIFFFATGDFIVSISNYLENNIPFLSFLSARKPVIFFDGILRALAPDLMLNILLLVMLEFLIVWLFHRRLNRFFKIDNLFTIKKIIWLAIIIMSIQLTISCWLWMTGARHGEIHPAETTEKILIERNEQ